jgi:hypothetical protein
MKMTKPYTLLGQKQAATVMNAANRMANSISDVDKGIGAQFTGINQANTIQDKSQAADQQRIDQLTAQQMNSDAKVNAYNLETLGKNRGLDAAAFKNIQLINANQNLAQNTAITNLIRGIAANIPVKAYKKTQEQLYKAYTDPNLQALESKYEFLNSDAGKKQYYDQ